MTGGEPIARLALGREPGSAPKLMSVSGSRVIQGRMEVAMQRPCHSRSRVGFLAATILLAVAALSPRAARAAGRIVVSNVEFGSYASEKEMAAALRKQARTTLKGDGAWTLNLMLFLGAPAGANKINIVYYDVSKRPPDQINFTEVGVKPDQKIIQLNGQTISRDLGFVKGHRYEIRATRLVGGKEKVYAKTTITLK
jgi:hypothetical protein